MYQALKVVVGYFSKVLAGALVFSLFTLISCLPEHQLATGYVKTPPAINLLVSPPETILKYNHKGEAIPGFDSLPEAQKDSMLWVTATYINQLNDSVLLEIYMNNFISELRSFGFTVYLNDAIDSFMTVKDPQSYVLSMVQMQVDEYLYPLEDEEPFQDTIYYKRFDLNAVDFSNWFELSKASAPTRPRKTILYSSHSAYDTFDGNFIMDPWTGSVKYRYKIDSLTMADLNDMAAYLGKKHASYLYDYFMNQYIVQHLPKGEELQHYYHFNRFRKSVAPADIDRFEVLGSK